MAKQNSKSITDIEAKDIVKLAGGPDEALFFVTWLKNGQDATSAYHELHPDITRESARVGGCRMLARVNPTAIMAAYNLHAGRYMEKIDRGLEKQKRDSYTGEVLDDEKAQEFYHTKLGMILGIEKNGTAVNVQNNREMNVELT